MAEETNGHVRWRDLDARDERLRKDYDESIRRLEASVQERFDRAHKYYSDAVADQMRVIGEVDERLDRVESVLDQMRGARNLIYALMGTNVILAVVGVVTILAFTGFLSSS